MSVKEPASAGQAETGAASAHTSRWMIGEVVLGGPFLLGAALQFALPAPRPQGILRLALLAAGMLLIFGGLRLVALARREFARHHQPTDPGQPTGKIITSGVFAVSRNPLYLGGALVLAGAALAANLVWALAGLPLSLILCHFLLILPEERYLAARFGGEYREYCARVHRWWGRKSRLQPPD